MCFIARDSIFDLIDGTNAFIIHTAGVPASWIDSYTNCAFQLNAANHFLLDAGIDGSASFTHCTIAASTSDAGNALFHDSAAASGPAVTLNLQNNILHLPGSDFGVRSGNANVNLTVNAGANLRNYAGGNGAGSDSLNGTIFEGDPLLAGDLIHLQAGSPALEKGLAVGLDTDIDGEARPRPINTNPDLGADEAAFGVVSSSKNWNVY